MKIKISPISSETVLERSCGEVTGCETLNFRTGKPVPGGLLCQQIFGPVKDYTCECGNYSGKVHRGKICGRCKVEIQSASERSKRMGHISLALPVIIPLLKEGVRQVLEIDKSTFNKIVKGDLWFKFVESQTGNFLVEGGTRGRLEFSIEKFPESRRSSYGLFQFLNVIDLEETAKIRKDIAKMVKKGVSPTDFFTTKIPVTPASWRPVLSLGKFWVSSSKNDLYTSLIACSSRARTLKNEFEAPFLILDCEALVLQSCVDNLMIKGSNLKKAHALAPIIQDLKGKDGLIRGNMLGKRIDYSGRSVIVAGPYLTLDEIGLPISMAYELFKPFVLNELLKGLDPDEYSRAKRLYRTHNNLAYEALERVCKKQRVLINRQPTLHRYGVVSFKIVLVEGKAIRMHPLVCNGFNADFDGDTVAVHVPLSNKALKESEQLSPINNLKGSRNGDLMHMPSHEMIIGGALMTKISKDEPLRIIGTKDDLLKMYDHKKLTLTRSVTLPINGKWIITCVGRVLIEKIVEIPVTEILIKSELKKLLDKVYIRVTSKKFAHILDNLKDLFFEHATLSGFSTCLDDFKSPPQKAEHFATANAFEKRIREKLEKGEIEKGYALESITRKWSVVIDKLQESTIRELGLDNSVVTMLLSGARLSPLQLRQVMICKGLIIIKNGKIPCHPIESSYYDGLTPFEYVQTCYASRQTLHDKKSMTASTGYLTRKLVTASRNHYIVAQNCKTSEGIWVPKEQAKGRQIIENSCNDEELVKIRSPITCEARGGLCMTCYGEDPATDKLVEMYTPVGIRAAQSVSEPSTQMSMRSFHTSGAASIKDSKLVVKSAACGKVSIVEGEFFITINIGKDAKYIVDQQDCNILIKHGQDIKKSQIIATYTSSKLLTGGIKGSFPLLENYYELRKPSGPAGVVSTIDGVVSFNMLPPRPSESSSRILPAVIEILVNGIPQGKVRDVPVFVHSGQVVKKGSVLSYGEINLMKLYNHNEDLDLLSRVFVDRVSQIYKDTGAHIHRIHFEMLIRALTQIVEKPDGSLDYRRFSEGKIIATGVTRFGVLNPSWLTRVAFGYLTKGLTNAALNQQISQDLPSERIMVGQRIKI